MERLRTRAAFQAVLAHPPVATSAHFALHTAAAVTAAPHIGVVLPKRWARRAVTRNALRRQIYAVAQAHAAHLPRQAWVVRLRRGFDARSFVSATSPALKRTARLELQTLFARVSTPLAEPAAATALGDAP